MFLNNLCSFVMMALAVIGTLLLILKNINGLLLMMIYYGMVFILACNYESLPNMVYILIQFAIYSTGLFLWSRKKT